MTLRPSLPFEPIYQDGTISRVQRDLAARSRAQPRGRCVEQLIEQEANACQRPSFHTASPAICGPGSIRRWRSGGGRRSG